MEEFRGKKLFFGIVCVPSSSIWKFKIVIAFKARICKFRLLNPPDPADRALEADEYPKEGEDELPSPAIVPAREVATDAAVEVLKTALLGRGAAATEPRSFLAVADAPVLERDRRS